MKKRFAMTFLTLAALFCASCSSLGHFNPAYDSFDRGLALFNQGRFDAAVPYFEDATHENPEYGQAYFYLGRAYLSQSKWRAAIQPLRAAFRLSPREAQQEIMDLILDATFAAALNDFKLGEERTPPPARPKELL
ncbi:MAG TPA: tetratricopeptide repeat protein [Terriglobales bacterium]|jgi:tetratricopeptide (TPR) repeat protein|nr:tetratricopeptide repeat protein [Terriglobales bacterium]